MRAKPGMQRREFLRRAATAATGAAVAPMIVPASALGRGGTVAPSERIVFGCIGLGGQGQHNMRAFISQPDTQIVALCDVEKGSGSHGLGPARAEALRVYADVGRPVASESIAGFGDFRELLARDDIDAVTVCTPDHWHGIISAAAAEAGKDIYCEKPLVNSIREGRAVCDAVRRNGRVLQTGSHERSNDSVRLAWELVHNGRIGDLKEIVVNMPNHDPHHEQIRANKDPLVGQPVPESLDFNSWLGPAPSAPYHPLRTHFGWRFVLDTGGGEMTDRGAHIIDLAQFIHDADATGPTEIRAKGKQVTGGLYDAFMEYTFELQYPRGFRILGSSEGDRGLKLVGTKGWIFIHIHGGRLVAEPSSILRETIGPREIHVERSPGHHRNFLDCVRARRKPVAHEEIGHRTATICHLLNIAMLLDRPLKWDPVRECVTNCEAAQRMTVRPMRAPWRI